MFQKNPFTKNKKFFVLKDGLYFINNKKITYINPKNLVKKVYDANLFKFFNKNLNFKLKYFRVENGKILFIKKPRIDEKQINKKLTLF